MRNATRQEKRMRKQKNRSLWAAVLAILGVGTAIADTATLKANDSSTNSAFTNETSWTIAGAPSSAHDYLVSGGLLICSPRWYDSSSPSVFNGHSLQIGEVGGGDATFALYSWSDAATVTIANEGLICAKGVLCNWQMGSVSVYGKIRVDSPSNTPFRIYSNFSGTTMRFHGPVSGAETSGLHVYTRDTPDVTGWSQTNFVARFVDNSLYGYSGRIVCSQYRQSAEGYLGPANIRTELATDGTFPGVLDLRYNCMVRGDSAASEITVGTVEFSEGAGINVIYDKNTKSASSLKITDAIRHSGKIRVLFAFAHTLGSYPDEDIVPELCVLKAPVGVTLDANDFVLERPGVPFPEFDLYVRTDTDGLSTLFLRQHGKVVTLLRSEVADDYNTNGASFVSGALWSDGKEPTADKDYYVQGMTIRAHVQDAASPVVFGGNSLALGPKARMELGHGEVVVSNLYFMGANSISLVNYWSNDLLLSGRIHNRISSVDGLSVQAYDNRAFRIGSEIDGDGHLQIIHMDSADKPGLVTIHGANSNFTGRLTLNSTAAQGANDANRNLRLSFDDPMSLGGPMPSWTFNGIRIRQYTRLIPLNSMRYASANRGIFIDGQCVVVCNEGIQFGIEQRLTWNGQMTKRGAGVLGLGGQAPYFTTNNGTTPVAGNNVLSVEAGSLKPLSAEAFTGVAVEMSAGSALVLEYPSDTTSGIGLLGMDLTHSSSSLTLPSGGVAVSVEPPADGDVKSIFVPICTVPSGSAGVLRGKFNLPSGFHIGSRLGQIAEKADLVPGSVTFGVKLYKGVVLSFR